MQFALFPELVYQRGLLCTPYHRVYFNDAQHTERVEKLPNDRWKFPVAAQLNLFAGSRTIIRSYYRWYKDNFGITSHTFQMEIPVELNNALSLAPVLRYYTQTGCRYFRPYREHDPGELYYTSDYDLSNFQSYKAGLTMRYAPLGPLIKNYTFNALSLRYTFYKRSDGLVANIISLLLEIQHKGPRPLDQTFSAVAEEK